MIVIGAGLSGLITARDLAQKSYKVMIFEASDRVGGRAWTKDFPGTGVKVDIGGEFYDASAHRETVNELRRQKLPIDRLPYEGSTAWLFHYPGKTVITAADVPADFEAEYKHVMGQINEDISRVNFREGLEQGAVMFLDVPFSEYLRDRCGATTFVEEYLLSEAFTMFQTDPSSLSTLCLLHCLAGFGTPEEILNTRPRTGEPFKKMDYARVTSGLGTLAERIANEYFSLGGEIRFNIPIGSIICEPVPQEGSKRYCAICTRYSYPKCSLHGPRVRVVDGLGRQYRGRGCVVSTPLNCIPCFKFDPPLPVTLQHASEMCNMSGDSQKVWMLAKNLATDINCVQGWPDLIHSHVKEVFRDRHCRTESVEEADEEIEDEESKEGGGSVMSMLSGNSGKLQPQAQGKGSSSFFVLRSESKDACEVEVPRVYQLDFTSTNHPQTLYMHEQQLLGQGKGEDEGKSEAAEAEAAAAAAAQAKKKKKKKKKEVKGEKKARNEEESEDDEATFEQEAREREEAEVKELRRQKRRQSILDTKQARDRDDFAAGRRSSQEVDAMVAHAHEEGVDNHIRAVVAGLGSKDLLGEMGEHAHRYLTKHHPSATAMALLSHDWKSDCNYRGGMFALRAGSAHLHAEACAQAQQPWEHTENLVISGGDVNMWWAGWIEGAVSNGKKSSKAMLHFLNPPVPVANHVERRYDDRELVLEIEKELNEQKRIEKEAERKRVKEEAEERKRRMFKY